MTPSIGWTRTRWTQRKCTWAGSRPIMANVNEVEPQKAKAEDDEADDQAKYDALQKEKPT